MLNLVCRQLLHRPLRTVFTLIAVAATIGAVLVIQGFQTGIYWQLPGLVLNRGGDLIVTQAGITNMIAARSTLPQLARRRIEAIDGATGSEVSLGSLGQDQLVQGQVGHRPAQSLVLPR